MSNDSSAIKDVKPVQQPSAPQVPKSVVLDVAPKAAPAASVIKR